jgi:hypothetical protein
MTVENTDLERPVLAHERILQALIAHMVSHAEQFIRGVMRLRENVGRSEAPYERAQPSDGRPLTADAVVQPDKPDKVVPTLFQVTYRAGIWSVTKNGAFYGHYFAAEPALEAATAAVHAIVADGGSAQVSTI